MEIRYVSDHQDLIPTLARWFHQEWTCLHPELSLIDVQNRLRARTRRDRILLALVAVDKGELLGTVSLKEQDMDNRADLSPWLAGLYVAETRRGQGIGFAVGHGNRAASLGIGGRAAVSVHPRVGSLLRSAGLAGHETLRLSSVPVAIMAKCLTDSPG